jgi:hypothetical protein
MDGALMSIPFFVCAYPYTNQGGEHMLIIFFLNIFFALHPL